MSREGLAKSGCNFTPQCQCCVWWHTANDSVVRWPCVVDRTLKSNYYCYDCEWLASTPPTSLPWDNIPRPTFLKIHEQSNKNIKDATDFKNDCWVDGFCHWLLAWNTFQVRERWLWYCEWCVHHQFLVSWGGGGGGGGGDVCGVVRGVYHGEG